MRDEFLLTAAHPRDEAIAVLGHGFDEAGTAGAVAELAAQCADALGERFVGDGDALPDFLEEALLGDQRPRLLKQQQERIEVARVELDRQTVLPEAALGGIDGEVGKTVLAVGHLSFSSETAHVAQRPSR